MDEQDVNADLVGFEFDKRDDGTRWRVTGTDPVLGSNYVQLRRVVDGYVVQHPSGLRVQNAGVVRRGKQITEAAA